MIETVQQRISRMEAEQEARTEREQRYTEAMKQPSSPLVNIFDSNKPVLDTIVRQPFDKNKYQREYMRTRRAAKKQGAR